MFILGIVVDMDFFFVVMFGMFENVIKMLQVWLFIMVWLDQLENSLLLKLIGVVKQLLCVVWIVYDEEIGLVCWMYWLDVMSQIGFYSLFG